MSSKNITYGPSEQELIPAGITQLFFPLLWFIIHSITCYTECHFSLNVFDKRVLVLLGQVLLFTSIMYQSAQTPAAAAELSLNIRVSTGLSPTILWSHKMGEPCVEPDTHNLTTDITAGGCREQKAALPFPNTARLKGLELRLLPRRPYRRFATCTVLWLQLLVAPCQSHSCTCSQDLL